MREGRAEQPGGQAAKHLAQQPTRGFGSEGNGDCGGAKNEGMSRWIEADNNWGPPGQPGGEERFEIAARRRAWECFAWCWALSGRGEPLLRGQRVDTRWTPYSGTPSPAIQGPLRPHRTMPLLASLFSLWQGSSSISPLQWSSFGSPSFLSALV